MLYYTETQKIREKVLPYLGANVIDIGCASDKIIPTAIGVDGRRMEGVDIVTDDLYNLSKIIPPESCDSLYSSHCLEHLKDDTLALTEWAKLIKKGGYLILYLPSADHYNNDNNDEHMRCYRFVDFMFYFRHVFGGEGKDFNGHNFEKIFDVEESGLHVGEDLYSFYVIAKKL